MTILRSGSAQDQFGTGGSEVGAGDITTVELADGTIAAVDIGNGAITTAKLHADVANDLAVDAAFTAAFAPVALGGVFYSAGTTLTDHTPNNTSHEQWGTEEAVIAQADAPASAVVVATLTGGLVAGPTSPAVGNRGGFALEVSFDGGSSFALMGQGEGIATLFNTTASRDTPLAYTGRATGTVTGDIQIRATCRDVDTANHIAFRLGFITCFVHPQ